MPTITVYASTADDEIYSYNATYSTANAGSNLTLRGATAATLVVGQQIPSDYYIHETFESFNTSDLPDDANISSVVLSIWPEWNPTVYAWDLVAKSVDWGTEVTTADWNIASMISTSPLRAYLGSASLGTGAYRALTSDSSFAEAVNRTGDTRLIFASNRTQANTAPTNYELISYSAADSSGTIHDPKLVITYSSPTIPSITATFNYPNINISLDF